MKLSGSLCAGLLLIASCSRGSLQQKADAAVGDAPVVPAHDGGAANVDVLVEPAHDSGPANVDVLVEPANDGGPANADVSVESRSDGGGHDDGGRDDGAADGAADGVDATPVEGRHAYVVDSTYRSTQDGGAPFAGSNGSHTFTLVLDATAGIAMVGATTVPLQRVDARTFRTTAAFSIALPMGCYSSVAYEELTLSVGDAGVVGSSRGRVYISETDFIQSTSATMSLVGRPDVVPPSVMFSPGTASDPMLDFGVDLSELLVPSGTAELRAADGSSIALTPVLTTDGRALVGFRKPNVVLRYGTTYSLLTTGLVDFAGNAGQAPANATFTTRAAPPLIAEDGFESAADGAYGGSQVVSGAGWPVVAGAKSLYSPVVSGGSPWLTAPLSLRIPLAPGDRVVRFSYRFLLSSMTSSIWMPTLMLGSVGTAGGAHVLAATSNETLAPLQPPDSSITIYVGQVRTAEIPIPPEATGELIIQRLGSSVRDCGLVPPAPGLVIDDLRAE